MSTPTRATPLPALCSELALSHVPLVTLRQVVKAMFPAAMLLKFRTDWPNLDTVILLQHSTLNLPHSAVTLIKSFALLVACTQTSLAQIAQRWEAIGTPMRRTQRAVRVTWDAWIQTLVSTFSCLRLSVTRAQIVHGCLTSNGTQLIAFGPLERCKSLSGRPARWSHLIMLAWVSAIPH